MKENKRKFIGRAEVFKLPDGWTIKRGYIVHDEKGNYKGSATHKGVALLMASKAIAAAK